MQEIGMPLSCTLHELIHPVAAIICGNGMLNDTILQLLCFINLSHYHSLLQYFQAYLRMLGI